MDRRACKDHNIVANSMIMSTLCIQFLLESTRVDSANFLMHRYPTFMRL